MGAGRARPDPHCMNTGGEYHHLKSLGNRAARWHASGAALTLALVLAGPARADEPAAPEPDAASAVAGAASAAPGAAPATSARVTRYDAGYFARFSPNTALDIVRQVPGFVLEQNEGEVRGFSQAAGNVVINGARPSSKSESLDEVLARIPASQVLRVELGPGDLHGSDFAGKTQVLNLVLSQESGISGNIKGSVARIHTGWTVPNLEGAVLVKRGNSTFNLSASSGRSGDIEVGYDDLTRVATGEQVEYRDKVNRIWNRRPSFAASWGNETSSRQAAHFNLSYSPGRFNLIQTNHVTPATGPQRDDRLIQDTHPNTYEIGGDISRPLGSGTVKVVALANRRDSNSHETTLVRVGNDTVDGYDLLVDSRYDEVLGRISWTAPKVAGFAFEAGSEIAYNRLDNATELYGLGPGGSRDQIDLPIAKAVVDEFRTESYLNLGRPLTSRLRLESRLAFETSTLNVSGDTTARRQLSYFKPGMTLDWKGPDKWHVQFAARRTVAQLDFFDFLSSAELANDRINGGNADLVPQRTWELRLTVDHPVLGDGVLRLELGHDRVSMLQDRILTPEGYDAPGNIGSGTHSFSTLTLDTPLDQLGIKATRLKLGGSWQTDSVRDPITGQDRRWSGFRPKWSFDGELRRDFAQWSYGVEAHRQSKSTVYRIDEIDSFFNSGPFVIAFAEFRPDKRTTLRLDAENAADVAGQRRRLFFSPNRTVAQPEIEEFRQRNSHVKLILSLNRTF